MRLSQAEGMSSKDGDQDGNGENKPGITKKRTFKSVEDEDKIYELSNKQFAEQSKRKIRWAVNLYCDWRKVRMQDSMCASAISRADLDVVVDLYKEDLAYALARFIREIKKLNGEEYPPNTLREVIIMIQMHLNQNGIFWKLLDDSVFVFLRNVLDNTMKERTAQGLGIKQSSSVISLTHEVTMFDKGALGEENPEQLLRTVVYMLGLHLALRGGMEHNRLRRPGFNPQIIVETCDSGKERLVYREDALQKTNQGGLTAKSNNKVVYVYPASDLRRCPVRLFKKYIGLLPNGKSCGKLYLRPKQKKTPATWFCDQPFGKNKVANVVKEICKIAGIEGRFTNHSLRATSASRMYNSYVPEQVIKEVTGHRSDCVRVYKKTSDEIREEASRTISGEVVVGDVEMKQDSNVCDEEEVESKEEKKVLTTNQIMKNVVKTRMEMRKKVKKGCKRLRQVAQKIVKRNKVKMIKKNSAREVARRFVIDLNVNVKMQK